MRQVLSRRFAKVADGEAQMPGLVLIDGGKGQVEVARQVFAELGLDIQTLVGVAKGKGARSAWKPWSRRWPAAGGAGRRIGRADADRPGARRGAPLRHHRHARPPRQARNVSRLEEIEGIGARRRQRLLARFGGFSGVASASIEDLASVDGISQDLAIRIYEALR